MNREFLYVLIAHSGKGMLVVHGAYESYERAAMASKLSIYDGWLCTINTIKVFREG